MSSDFYCDEVLSGKTQVRVVMETQNILAFHHTRPSYPVHIVVIPKHHIDSLLTVDMNDRSLIVEMMRVIQQVAATVTEEHNACRIVTNLGKNQDSKHLHWHVISGVYFEPK